MKLSEWSKVRIARFAKRSERNKRMIPTGEIKSVFQHPTGRIMVPANFACPGFVTAALPSEGRSLRSRYRRLSSLNFPGAG